MTRRPFNPGEADLPRDLEPTVADLERYLADSAVEPAPDFADRVMREVSTQPTPRRGLWAMLAGVWAGDRGRMALLLATAAAAVLLVVIAGQLPRLLPSTVGTSPSPSVVPTMEPTPSFTVSPRPTEPATESAEPSRDEEQTPLSSASPSGSDDHSGSGDDDGGNSGPGGSSPEASDDSEDHSGSGGGDGSDD